MRNFLFQLLFFIALVFSSGVMQAQMPSGSGVLYGNEWIQPNTAYIKIKVSQDNVYRLTGGQLVSSLTSVGASLSDVRGANLRLYHLGQEVPIFVTTQSGFSSSDAFEFIGRRNTGQIDSYLFEQTGNNVNPYTSLFSDSSAYFLSWTAVAGASPKRLVDTPNDLSVPLPTEAYYIQKSVTPYTVFSGGAVYQPLTSSTAYVKSSFDKGEGYSKGMAQTHSLSFNTSGLVSTGPAAKFETRLFCSKEAHRLNIELGGVVLGTDNPPAFAVKTYSYTVNANRLSSTTTNFDVKGTLASSDQYSPGYASLEFPRSFDFGNQKYFEFWVEASAQPKFLVINNFNLNNATPFFYDLTTGMRIEGFVDGNKVKVVLPATSVTGLRNLILCSETKASATMVARQFKNLSTETGNYLIVSHKSLIGGAQSGVNQYADYRRGTGYLPIVLDISEVEDQFAYGVAGHNLSLYNLSGFAQKNWTVNPPEYIFIIGKGLPYTQTRDVAVTDMLVPAYGLPPSDVLHTAATGGIAPRIAIGRYVARENADVINYLTKVRDLEAQIAKPQTVADKGWMKNVIHLGGGTGAEAIAFKNVLNSMATTISKPLYGANVQSFFKNSTSPIQQALSTRLDSLINAGTSIITFMGHSSPNSFDYNLDRPQNYNNRNKYPLIISLGCYAGGINNDNSRTIGESFVGEPNRGAIGFLASSDLSLSNHLSAYANQFYRELSKVNVYRKGVGLLMKKTIEQLALPSSSDEFKSFMPRMTYNGDPAVNLNTHGGPDYLPSTTLTSITPNIDISRDSFEIKFLVHNIGSALDTVLDVQISRTMPSGLVINNHYQKTIRAPYNQTEMTLKLPVGGSDAIGVNNFSISLDKGRKIAEYPNPAAEFNNELAFTVFIFSDDILPISPTDYGIVGASTFNLRASASQLLSRVKQYTCQIDTTRLFNSPIMQEDVLIQAGGVIDFQPNIPKFDSTVYYWRVSTEPKLGEPRNWQNRSFIYLANYPYTGWNQSHYYQFSDDRYKNLNLTRVPVRDAQIKFVNNLQEITGQAIHTRNEIESRNYVTYLNGSAITTNPTSCVRNNGVFVVVVDSTNMEAWKNPHNGNRYGSAACGQFNEIGLMFPTETAADRFKLFQFLTTNIPTGHYVLITTINDYRSDTWLTDNAVYGDNLIRLFESYGATKIRQTATDRPPYAFFFQSNRPAFPGSDQVTTPGSILSYKFTIPGNWSEGNIKSTVIGPVDTWRELKWRSYSTDNRPTDAYKVDIYGINAAQQETFLQSVYPAQDTSLLFLNNLANTYPQIRLQYEVKDAANRTPRQLRYWRIVYDPLLELSLRPELLYSVNKDTLQAAENYRFRIAASNISDKTTSDSTIVSFSVLGHPELSQRKKYKPLQPNDTIQLQYDVPTLGLGGPQQMTVEINPDKSPKEITYLNNVLSTYFLVNTDRINPLLDVTFDGTHIFNGDIVSPTPNIHVTLRDENKYLALNDTSSFKLYLIRPGKPLERIYFAQNYVQFIPATSTEASSGKNKAQIHLTPTFNDDGLYTLYVEGSDKSGNQSGNLQYKIQFKVINKPSISNILNYPNPFSTSTQFVFTLTGNQVPSDMRIQIMTVSGKVVREITQAELGLIKIGQNLTEYKWDGTDQFGDKLANGVYLYRVIVKDANGNSFDKYETNTNQFFEQGFGKMYIMR